MTQPEYRARFYCQSRSEKLRAFRLQWHKDHPEFADQRSAWMKQNNPMKGHVSNHKGNESIPRRNNWESPTNAESVLLDMLNGEDPKWNLVFATKNKIPPWTYIADIALPHLKLIVEADGPSHSNPKVRERDRKKDAFFGAIGWKVLRFSNRQILKRPEQVQKALLSTISILKSITPTV